MLLPVKVAILTWGSRGDYQPYLGLAAALQSAGHEVILGAPPGPGFATMAQAHLVPFAAVGPATDAALVVETANRAIASANAVKAVRLIMDQLMLPAIDRMYAQAIELTRWSDVVVSHFLQFTGRMAAETVGRPFISGTLVPTQLPTNTRLPGSLRSLGGRVNGFVWKVATTYMNAAWLPPLNEARVRFGLSPFRDVAREGFYSPRLNLIAMSPRIYRPPSDWHKRHQMTGYWLLDTAPGWHPSAEVEAFLAAGPGPVAVGFGSMASQDTALLTKKVLRAICKAGVRAILEPGMAELGATALPPGVIVADSIPHSWLLPRVAALVHHGGAGTSGAVFQSGKPSVFVPHIFDQYLWGARAARLGVAPKAIPARDLTSDALAQAIRRTVDDAGMRQKAARLGRRLREERGLERAVQLIERFADSHISSAVQRQP